MKNILILFFLFPALAYSQATTQAERPTYQVKSVIIPAALSLCAGMSADTDAGRIGQQTCLFGATFTIGLTKRPTAKSVLINFGISGVSFLAGRGIREIIK